MLSGSFPGLNLALLSACDALGLECVYTVSLGSSTYGANQPALNAPEMLLLLYEKGLIASPPALITPGGQEDSGQNMMGWAFPEAGTSWPCMSAWASPGHGIMRRPSLCAGAPWGGSTALCPWAGMTPPWAPRTARYGRPGA